MRTLISFICTLLFIIMVVDLTATPVSLREAKKTGANYINSFSETDAISESNLFEVSLNNVTYPFYIFNIDRGGFIIVSATDNVYPVLGYSFSGKITETDIAPCLKKLFEGYKEEIDYAKSNNISASSEISSLWQSLSTANREVRSIVVEPLISTNWGQGFPYNSQCPVDISGNGGHTLAGCVAVAIGQVIKYWEFPSHGTGEYGYYSNYNGYNYGYLYANFENTYYDYDNMPASINSLSPDMQINAIASLLYHCGIAVNMQYGPALSESYTVGSNPSGDYALRNYFGFGNSTARYRYNYSSESTWINFIISDLNNGYPVIYAASDPDLGGHAFVCDGYTSDNYFHFNWGWTGNSNGYFLISNLNPLSGYYHFSNNHRLITDIYPTAKITSTPDKLSFHTTTGIPSDYQIFNIDPVVITDSISIFCGPNFELSINSVNWADTLTVPPVDQSVYVRFTPLSFSIFHEKAYIKSSATIYAQIDLYGNSCEVFSSFPYFESFEEGAIPECWGEFLEVDTIKWRVVTSMEYAFPQNAHSGHFYATYKPINFGHYASSSKLISPEFNLKYLTNPYLTFWYILKKENPNYQDYLNIYYRESIASQWILLKSYTSNIEEWSFDSIPIPSFSNTCSFAFESTYNLGFGIQIDDITVSGTEIISSPTLFTNIDTLAFSAVVETSSPAQSINISGILLTDSIHLQTDAPFQIYCNNNWSNTGTMAPNSNSSLLIKYFPEEPSDTVCKLNISSLGAESKIITLIGTTLDAMFLVSISSSTGGSTLPSEDTAIHWGNNLLITFLPDPFYEVDSIIVNDHFFSNVNNLYNIDHINKNYYVFVSFKYIPHPAITVSNSSLSFSTTVNINSSSQLLNISGIDIQNVHLEVTPPFLISNSSIWVNSLDVNVNESIEIIYSPSIIGNDTGYLTLTAVGVDSKTVTLYGESLPLYHTIFISHNIGGTVSPGTVDVIDGTNIDFIIMPDNNHIVNFITVDFVQYESDSHYYFENVICDHFLNVNFQFNSSINNITGKDNDIIIFPSPANETVTLYSQSIITNITLYSATGKLLMNINNNSNSIVLNRATLSSGLYILSIKIDSESYWKKILFR